MQLLSNYSLKKYNTFGMDVKSDLFIEPASLEDLEHVIKNSQFKSKTWLILGGGSNILFTQDFRGLVIHPVLKGLWLISEGDSNVIVKAAAGENWDDFVEWTINHSYAGLENLSKIPGTIGACPVQNIGAYGVEVGDRIEKVEAVDIETGQVREFQKEECKFGYRDSVFKHELRNKYIISAVYFKLDLYPEFKINYGAVKDELAKLNEINLVTVRQAIINIRESKLPNPEILPNAGSFFKNPVVSKEKALALKAKFPAISSYDNQDDSVKLAAGWMIDYLNWKGKCLKGAKVHDNQALVLVNYNCAKGNDILQLAENIKKSVWNEFGVELEYEVNIV